MLHLRPPPILPPLGHGMLGLLLDSEDYVVPFADFEPLGADKATLRVTLIQVRAEAVRFGYTITSIYKQGYILTKVGAAPRRKKYGYVPTGHYEALRARRIRVGQYILANPKAKIAAVADLFEVHKSVVYCVRDDTIKNPDTYKGATDVQR